MKRNPRLFNVEQTGAHTVVVNHGNVVVLQYHNEPIAGYFSEERTAFELRQMSTGAVRVARGWLRERGFTPKDTEQYSASHIRNMVERGADPFERKENPRQVTVYGDHNSQTEPIFSHDDLGDDLTDIIGDGDEDFVVNALVMHLERIQKYAYHGAEMRDRIGNLIDELTDESIAGAPLREVMDRTVDVLQEYTHPDLEWVFHGVDDDPGDTITLEERE